MSVCSLHFPLKRYTQLTYNITLWSVRVIFIPPRLSQDPQTISVGEDVVRAIYVAGKNKPYLGLQVKCPTFLSDFNQTRIFSTDFNKSRQYKISRKSVQWLPSCSMHADKQTDRHCKANRRLSRLRLTRLKTVTLR
jgi:hypothetical protein